MKSIYLDIVCATFPKVEASIAVRRSGKMRSESEQEKYSHRKAAIGRSSPMAPSR
jgi:hypothetical protein